jgi:tetratricopeptide (TPR) repeat protein
MAVGPRAAPLPPHDRANAALANPLMLPAVPLRGSAFVLRGPDRSKVQVLVHADIDVPRSGSRVISVAYVLLDAGKRAVDGQISDLRIDPSGDASPLQYSRTAMVDPGEYMIRIAVVDADLVGSVEFPLRAEVARAGRLDVTQLVVGGPRPLSNPAQPTLGPEVRFGLVQGYFEAYGADAAGLAAAFDVVKADEGPAVLSARAPGRRGGDDRFIFSTVMPVAELPAGAYRLRSTLDAGGDPIVKARPFEIVRLPPTADAPVFLTVSAADLGRPLDPGAALQPATIKAVRAHLPAPPTAAFDEALTRLRARAYVEAATALERAIESGADQGAALAYLGVCYAAAGHDTEAIAAWRRALTDGADAPEVHAWIIDALLRTKRYGDGRSATEAASARWPADSRFARPLAVLRASGGSARDAVLALDRYLDQQRGDAASLFLALTWMFEARQAGLRVRDRGEEIRLARSYAAQYAALNGPRQPLVNLWIEYLER